jgi:hypothetical protein
MLAPARRQAEQRPDSRVSDRAATPMAATAPGRSSQCATSSKCVSRSAYSCARQGWLRSARNVRATRAAPLGDCPCRDCGKPQAGGDEEDSKAVMRPQRTCQRTAAYGGLKFASRLERAMAPPPPSLPSSSLRADLAALGPVRTPLGVAYSGAPTALAFSPRRSRFPPARCAPQPSITGTRRQRRRGGSRRRRGASARRPTPFCESQSRRSKPAGTGARGPLPTWLPDGRARVPTLRPPIISRSAETLLMRLLSRLRRGGLPVSRPRARSVAVAPRPLLAGAGRIGADRRCLRPRNCCDPSNHHERSTRPPST